MVLLTILLIDILSRLTRHRTRRILLTVVLAVWVVPAIPLIGIIRVLLAIILAARVLTTILLIDSVLAISLLSSYSSRRMAQHPAVSDTLRAALTSRRSPTWSLQLTRCHSCQHGRARHPPHPHHTCSGLLAIVLATWVLPAILLIDM